MSKKNKILTITALKKILTEENDELVVLCHGVFDLLHIGHIKYFEEAKSMGGKLIVTLTPDRFVNKGPHRPFFNENLRVEAISALEVVDYVAINEWPTAIETIHALKPDVYVKGPDFKIYKDDLTGNIELEEEAVKSIGGRIAFTSGQKFSSSNIINKHFNTLNLEQKQYIEKLKQNISLQQINDSIYKLEGLRVLLVGEAIIDEYVICNSIGKSGKEPVLVSKKIGSDKYAGGVLSVANHVSEFCRKVKVLTYLGDRDSHKPFILNSMNENIDLDYVEKHDSPTILKTRYIDDYSKTKIQGIYDLNDNNLNDPEEKEFLQKLSNCIENFDLVLVVDYGHGLITSPIVKMIENKSKYLAVNTQLNSFNLSFHSISKYSKADYVCVHSKELRHDYRNRNDEIESLTQMLFDRLGAEAVLITLGKNGSLVLKENEFSHCPAFATKVVDRVGAGDTFLAISSISFANGVNKDITALLGNLSAAETVASTGTGNLLSKISLLKTVEVLYK